MFRILLLLVLSSFSNVSLSASFDCSKAKTNIEKLICGTQQLSELDSKLEETYSNQRKRFKPVEENSQKPSNADEDRLVAEQKHWLKHTRNACSDEACLKQAYTDRIDALDPFADGIISCENMRKFPEKIFIEGIDLGSGHNSPIEVDYGCPESLASLPFMKNLLDLTESIRQEAFGHRHCSGSIIHAHWRYYHFDLAKAGFAPLLFLEQAKIDQDPDDERSFASLRPAILHKNLLGYFQQWSEKSLYNSQMHKQFFSEFDKALPKLATHYKSSLNMTETQATEAARHALMRLVGRAAGSFPSEAYTPESKLVQLVRESQTTLEDLKTELAETTDNGQPIPKQQIYQALKAALLHDRPKAFIATLIDKLSSSDLAGFENGAEPLLSLSIGNHESLRFLLEKQISVNVPNDFGKTALFYAIGENDHEATELLLAHKADVNHSYKSAAELRNGDECVYPNLGHTKRTPLMHAAQHADVDMLKLLIKHGANLNAADERGFNALDFAVVMAKNKENETYLKSLGLEQNLPAYTPEATINEVKLSSIIPVDGYINKLTIAPLRPDVLLASVTPWDKLVPDDVHGVYLFSLADPDKPKVISHFPAIKADDFAVSPDGKTVYLISLWYDGAPADKKYGLFIVDISNAQQPKLIERIDGSFMTLHLSRDGEYLFLQERNRLPDSLDRGTLVYKVGKDATKLICSNPFKTEGGSPIFAYSFTEFDDAHQIAIVSSSGGFYYYDIKDPCKPTTIFNNASSEEFGPKLIGLSDKTVMSGVGGLYKYRVAEPPTKLFGYSWSSGSQHFTANERLNLLTAVFDKNVAVFKNKPNGRFALIGQYRSDKEALGDVHISDAGRIYIGGKGNLKVVSILPLL
ncbi:ankyrin repeat domain-containing protein [Methylomonas sp. EFPC1]|uniref:ankyrin repeat domain-containing protein n=1 Tax=Methylomonas sp. EFPC1 TaxID=2812647 RepID=UPI001967F0B3|nr:ankyrin repeat domain-containing protein [Methylomonas sp. EFPC1]QSA99482.1 ankyrin repeat domain-containing protein [Methylomonas sp. EFPC1]